MPKLRHWFATADSRRATLFWCRPTPGGHPHVEADRTLENEFEGTHEHHRPSPLGRGPTANGVQHHASFGHEEEEFNRRFAKRVADWLAQAAGELKPRHVTIFAAPRFLGFLRPELSDGVRTLTEIIEAELTRLRPNELAEHPSVRAIVERAAVPPA